MPLQAQYPPDPGTTVRIPKLQVRGRDLPSRAASNSPRATSPNTREVNSISSREENSGSELGPTSSWSPDSSPPRSRTGSPDNVSNKRKRKERSSLLGFFSTKEPSQMALKEFAKLQKQQALQGQRTITPSFQNQKLPKTVPKVNSKWDGMPNHFHHKEGKPWEVNQQSTALSRTSTKASAASSVSDSQGSFEESSAKSKPKGEGLFTYIQPPRSPKRTRVTHSTTSSDAESAKPPKQLKRESIHRTGSFEIPAPEDPRAGFRRSWSESRMLGKPRFSFLDRPDSEIDADDNVFPPSDNKLQLDSDPEDSSDVITATASPDSQKSPRIRKLPPPIVTSVEKLKVDVGTRYPIDDSPVTDSKVRGLEARLSLSTLQSSDEYSTYFPIQIPASKDQGLGTTLNTSEQVDSGTMYSPATPVSPVSTLSHDSSIFPSSPVSPMSPFFQDSNQNTPTAVPETKHIPPIALGEGFKPVQSQKKTEWPLPPIGTLNWPLTMNPDHATARSPALMGSPEPPLTPKQSNYSFLSSESGENNSTQNHAMGQSPAATGSKSKTSLNNASVSHVPATPPRNFSRATPPRSPKSPQSPIQSLNINKIGTSNNSSPSRTLIGPPGRAVSKGISLPSIPESDASSILSLPLQNHDEPENLPNSRSASTEEEEDDDVPTPRASRSASPELRELEQLTSKQRLGLGGIIRHPDDHSWTIKQNYAASQNHKTRKTPFFSGKIIK